MAGQDNQPEKKTSRGGYSTAYSSTLAIWQALRDGGACAEHPMTIADICQQMKGMELHPSRSSLTRIMPAVRELMPLLTSDSLSQVGDPAPIHCYKSGDDLHVVVENQVGRALLEGILRPSDLAGPQALPSTSTVDKSLKRTLDTRQSPHYPMECCAQLKEQGQVSYEDMTWEKEQAQSRADGEPPARLNNNVPRQYYLSSPLTQAEWRVFYDMVRVYPFLDKRSMHKYLSVLDLFNPGKGPSYSDRYAWRTGSTRIHYVLQTLDEAIRSREKVTLEYGEQQLKLQRNGCWQPVLAPRPSREPMTVEPYALIWSNGSYYLVCKHMGMMNLRVDRILRADLTGLPAQVPQDFDPVEYRDSCPVMYPGEHVFVRLRCKVSILNVLVDFFGQKPSYSKPVDGQTEVTMSIAPAGVKLFALQYADSVEVLEPRSIREEVAQSLRAALDKYQS